MTITAFSFPKQLLRAAVLTGLALTTAMLPAAAQQRLTLDSCRAMALRSNKQLGVARIKQDVADNLRRNARTKYLPHVSAVGTYEHTSAPLELLSDDQKVSLSNLGTNAVTGIGQDLAPAMQGLAGQLVAGGIPATVVQDLMGKAQQGLTQGSQAAATVLNAEGQKFVDALQTDTRNIWAGTILLTQPLFMGGAIVAANRMADLNMQLQSQQLDARQQTVVYATDRIYWQVVSLRHKQRLAEGYLKLVEKLDGDVAKMIHEGVATRSEGLSVSVKVSEAEMALQRVNNGLTLSRMLLCQQIGLPLDSDIRLEGEDSDDLAVATAATEQADKADVDNRPEIQMLSTAVDMSRQLTNIARATTLPQLMLTGGYAVSNPNVLNGFQKKFGGFWHVGVMMRVPIWSWRAGTYRIRAAKGTTAIANLELAEAREKVELQLNQTSLQVSEANKRLALAAKSIARAEENLRTANLGFAEGVISPTVVMEAQTAWLQAQSQRIDAQIDVMLSLVELRKAQGRLK